MKILISDDMIKAKVQGPVLLSKPVCVPRMPGLVSTSGSGSGIFLTPEPQGAGTRDKEWLLGKLDPI